MTLLMGGERISDRKVRLLMIDHIFAVVKVEQIALLTIDDGLSVQFVAFALKSLLELLLRVGTADIPVNSFDFLFELAVLLTGIRAIFDLLVDVFGLGPHERALRHTHRHHLLLLIARCIVIHCAAAI